MSSNSFVSNLLDILGALEKDSQTSFENKNMRNRAYKIILHADICLDQNAINCIIRK